MGSTSRIGYTDALTDKKYVFLTNNFKLSAKTIAEVYKARWQVELFFKWIKQNLKIKSFVGTSKNAVLTQIWIALCVYLILAFIKLRSRLTKSMQQILRLLQLNLFEKRDLMALLRGDPVRNSETCLNQMTLLWKLTGQQCCRYKCWFSSRSNRLKPNFKGSSFQTRALKPKSTYKHFAHLPQPSKSKLHELLLATRVCFSFKEPKIRGS